MNNVNTLIIKESKCAVNVIVVKNQRAIHLKKNRFHYIKIDFQRFSDSNNVSHYFNYFLLESFVF